MGNHLNPSPASAAHDSDFSSPRRPWFSFQLPLRRTELGFLTADNLKAAYEKAEAEVKSKDDLLKESLEIEKKIEKFTIYKEKAILVSTFHYILV